MDYIKQLEAFERRLINYALPVRSQLLWYKFWGMYTNCGFGEWVSVGNRELMAMANIASETTFIAAREELVRGGFIEYYRGNRGSCGYYRMVRLFDGDVQAENEGSKNGAENTKNEVQSLKNGVENSKNGVPNIYNNINNKLINNNYINNKLINNNYINNKSVSQSSQSFLGVVKEVEEQLEVYVLDRLTDRQIVEGICKIIAEVYQMPAYNRDGSVSTLNINQKPMAVSDVQQAFRTLKSTHIELVVENFNRTTTLIKNKRAYFHTAIFNAVQEIDVHYANLVKHDYGF